MSEQYELTINELIAKIRRYENQIEALRTEIKQDRVMMGACRDAINDLRKHVEKLEKEADIQIAQPEIVRCEDCMHNGSVDTDCPISWNGKDFCSFGERRLKWQERR